MNSKNNTANETKNIQTFGELVEAVEQMEKELPKEWKVQSVMVRKDGKADQSISYRVPAGKTLREMEIPVLATTELRGVIVTVFANGLTEYVADGHRTVFALKDCMKNYIYGEEKNNLTVPVSEYWNSNWSVRLFMEGEDRIAHNLAMADKKKKLLLEQEREENLMSCDLAEEYVNEQENNEMVEKYLSMLTNRQREIIYRYIILEESQEMIAKSLGISQAAVADAVKHGLARIRKKLEKN